jgi:HSP90 family molecular chaperone
LENSLSCRFSGKIERLLGRESVSSEIVALFELIKNSYDADATRVEVIFKDVTKPGGTIRIKDDGHGMTIEDFKDRWMIVGTESKERHTTSKKGRRMVGEKGVGRFSTEKLARKVTVISNPRGIQNKITVEIKRRSKKINLKSKCFN